MKTIFVSSTFKDMHFERDIIHERVTPALNNAARQYGESVSFCDLRWGVNTGELESEEGSRKVLSVCLDEIDRCRPYMLVILGERYGWIPSEELIADAAKRANFALDELEKSVTALEIEYGALSNPEQLERTLFYFREIEGDAPGIYRQEDERHAAKLRELKERIAKVTGGRVKTYRLRWDGEQNCPVGLEDFAALVESDVRALMEDEWKAAAALTPYQRDQRGQWDYAGQKARQFSAREGFVSDCIQALDSGTNLLALQGKSGAGKSTLMARLAQQLQKQGREVLPLFCGTTALCNDGLDLIKYIIDHLETKLALPHFAGQERKQPPAIKEWTGRLEETVGLYNARGEQRLVILIDAVDQLFDDENRDFLRFVPFNLSAKVQLVLSCLEDFQLGRPMECKAVAPLAEADRPEIIAGILGFLGRELDRPVIDEIVRKPSSDNPLYLSLILQRLTMMNKADFDAIAARGDGMEAITAHQIELVQSCSDSLDGICVDILSAAAERIGGAFVQSAAQYLAVSRHGLRESDLEGILSAQGMEWRALDFAQFVRYLSTFFLLRDDGRYDFAHQSIRRGILARCGDETELHRHILAHFQTLDAHDEVRVREITCHCIKADDRQAFVDYVEAYEDDQAVIPFAARDVHDLALEDGGAWLTELLEQGEQYGAARNLLNFVNNELNEVFLPSQRELLLNQVILEAGLAFALRLNEVRETTTSQRDMSISYERAGDIYKELDGMENLQRALELYQRSLKLREALARELGTAQSRRELAVSYEKVGGIYQAMGGTDNLQRALELYQRSLKLREALARELGTAESRRDLSISCNKIGGIYQAMGGTENLRRALELYQKSMALLKDLAQELGIAQSRRDLAVSYNKVGGIYEALGGTDNLQRALELYQKDLVLSEELARELGTAQSRRDLSVSYNKVGDIYEALGGTDNLQRALDSYQKCLALSEELARELGTAQSRRDLSLSYNFVGGIYEALGGAKNLQRALELYQKSMALSEELARELGTAQSRRDLSVSYNKVGGIYKALGGTENLRRALELYQKDLELSDELARQLKTVPAYDDLAVACYKIGRHPGAEIAVRRRNLERFLELSELLFQQTQSERHRKFVSDARRELAKLPPVT